MCGRYTLTRTTLGEIVGELHADLSPSAEQLQLPRYNIGPGQSCVIARAADEAQLLTAATWGLRLGPRKVINLRAETAARLHDLQRCIVPGDGFFEWTGAKGHKRPIWFHRPDGGLIFFAGLADAETFAIVTDAASGPVLEIHDRAPVMFTAAAARTWLGKGGGPKGEAVELVGVEVSPRANAVLNDDASLLEPVQR